MSGSPLLIVIDRLSGLNECVERVLNALETDHPPDAHDLFCTIERLAHELRHCDRSDQEWAQHVYDALISAVRMLAGLPPAGDSQPTPLPDRTGFTDDLDDVLSWSGSLGEFGEIDESGPSILIITSRKGNDE